MSWKIGILFLLMGMALIGCNIVGGNQDAQAEVIPSQIAAPADTVLSSPLPPTATLEPYSTLPPTWTPAPTRTLAVREPTVLPTTTPSPTPVLVPEDGCSMFFADLERNAQYEKIFQGDTALIYWSEISLPGYQYRVQLHHPAGMVTVSRITSGDRFAFTAQELNSPGYTFGWQVQPILSDGTLVCYPLSGEIFVEPSYDE